MGRVGSCEVIRRSFGVVDHEAPALVGAPIGAQVFVRRVINCAQSGPPFVFQKAFECLCVQGAHDKARNTQVIHGHKTQIGRKF